MPDSTPKDSNEEPKQDSVDLSDLQSFSFGTQWTAASKSSPDSGKPRFHKGGPRGGDRSDRRPGASGPARKDRRPPRSPRPDGGAGDQGHGDRPQQRGDQGGRRPQRRGGRNDGPRAPFHPYESPVFDVCFYPEDNCFSAIIKAMRGNHMTYELFQVAKLFMEKPDRFIASVTRKPAEGQKPEKVSICAIDNMPFANDEEAIAHAMAHHAGEFFTIEEVEVEAPSGNFPFVNRCPFTKELLGPPNYHKYEVALRNHHRTRLPNMSFEKLQSAIETVREEEVVAAWLESQKKATRYTAKETPEGEEAKVFGSVEDAMAHLRTALKSKVVKQVNYARVAGNILEQYQDSEAFKAMDGERQRQQRFPLDAANAIRGRMRREKFSIYKKGAKGITYVCSTKRNFRSPGQVMSPDLDRIIRFLETHQLTKAKELPAAYQEWLKSEGVEEAADEKKIVRDLHWLIADGYISHFEDDSLFAQPVLDTGTTKQKTAPGTKGSQKAPKSEESSKADEPKVAEAAASSEAAPVESNEKTEEASANSETSAGTADTATDSAVPEEAASVEVKPEGEEEAKSEMAEESKTDAEAEATPADLTPEAKEPVEAAESDQDKAEEKH
ncbi:hypothetical protein [Pelagicoccus sp. SDUM812002]|uniref:hypothetical protein n=1 Tax=Pelagicoccus sp. SDUM812002 TaxID=3041266 RepID=UPI00280F1236|nr:hypothetical protein [Pelagicoccus sp. SDUM812002]MDQ8187582.1 hypothetical protein [Pelagicoccus sp. SDUM812002]